MQTSTIVIAILVLGTIAYRLGRRRSLAVVGGPRGISQLHSLPGYYGLLTAVWCAFPALAVLGAWHLVDQRVIVDAVLAHMPGGLQDLPADQKGLLLNDIKNVVQGNVAASDVTPAVQAAAREWQRLDALSRIAGGVLALCVGLGGGTLIWRRITPALRARNRVEWIVELNLLLCSMLAILTTIGIVI